MKETKNQRFKRIAGARTEKLLDMIRLLGNCSDTRNYTYSSREVQKIFTTLEKNLNNVKASFLKETSDSKTFKL